MKFPSLDPVARMGLILALMALPMAHAAVPAAAPPALGATLQVRGGLANARVQFERQKKGNVAFLGGSITEMNGYRPLVCASLQQRFPQTAFTFTNAGIASTCSNTGAFRLQRDVLDHGPVDLLFVEFAVNDDQDGHCSRAECIRGMEGIIRQARLKNPNLDIVMTFFVNEGMIRTYQAGGTPLPIEAHEAVATAYAVPTVNVARELTARITAGTLTWQQYGGVHPGPAGNQLCARMMEDLFGRVWAAPPAATAVAHPVPAQPLDPFSYFYGRFIDPGQAKVLSGWTLAVPDWSSLAGGKRSQFTTIPMLAATEPGAAATLAFEGTAVGAFIVAGPDAGMVEASVDGGAWRKLDLFTNNSGGLHYPWTVMLGTELPPGKHLLTMRIAAETRKTGHAMRIIQFTAN